MANVPLPIQYLVDRPDIAGQAFASDGATPLSEVFGYLATGATRGGEIRTSAEP
ncbi:hypothetical protein ACWDOP_19710 [Nocardia sp. NPDC003693]